MRPATALIGPRPPSSSGASPLATSVRSVPARILVVEDEIDIARLMKQTLERSGGFGVEIAESGDEALKIAADRPPDLVLLDVNLPVLNGFEVCRILRDRPATARVPVIMVTARTAEHDRVSGLDLGADDFITKPFSLRELVSRVRAVLRRTLPQAPPPSSEYRGRLLEVDFDAVSVAVAGEPVALTRREFELLRVLVENRKRVLPRERLLDRVWGHDRAVSSRSIDVYVGRLRAKLGPAGDQIETVVGIGYRFVE